MTDVSSFILKASLTKYKYLAIPIIVILICFFYAMKNPPAEGDSVSLISPIKVFSILAMILYALILVVFRFRKYFPIPAQAKITAPVNGKVVNIDKIPQGHIITIEKPFFASAEVVTCTNADIPFGVDPDNPQVSWEISGMLSRIFIDEPVPFQGALVGIAPGRATCEIYIPLSYAPMVFKKSRVKAGESVIAKEVGDNWASLHQITQ